MTARQPQCERPPVDYRYESTMPEPSISAPVDGFCEPRFERVREALEGNLRERGELGAAVSVIVDGRPVVDIWGGWMDVSGTRPWQRDTLVDVFSAGKPMAAVCVLMLSERGVVDLDAPVARYWPEFAAHGKGAISVRTLLSHHAGLPGIRRALPAGAMFDWELMAETLAGEEPWWEPGTRHGYHVNTFGFLAGEVVRRVTGASVGDVAPQGDRGAAGGGLPLRRPARRRTRRRRIWRVRLRATSAARRTDAPLEACNST